MREPELLRGTSALMTVHHHLCVMGDDLNDWRNFDSEAVVERGALVELVEPRFNRLTVFDPRLPHGVPVVGLARRSQAAGPV